MSFSCGMLRRLLRLSTELSGALPIGTFPPNREWDEALRWLEPAAEALPE